MGHAMQVFTIVVLQLMVTVGFACVCIFVNPVKVSFIPMTCYT